MIQHLLDEHAQTNAICHINPITKLTLGIGTLIITLISPSPVIPILSAIFLSGTIIFIAKIPGHFFFKLLLIPAGFTIISVTTIILLTGGDTILWQMPLTSWLILTISIEGIEKSIQILARVLGGTISLLFISLTIPFTDIIQIMNRIKVPQELTDLMTILYRNIFVLLSQATQIHAAQVMRLGYSHPKEATESFAMLCGSLFISSWNAGDDLIRAMDCRCYNGKFAPLTQVNPVHWRSMIPVILVLAFLASSLFIIKGGITQ
jgi:cobalt/nickel transport system permease protein